MKQILTPKAADGVKLRNKLLKIKRYQWGYTRKKDIKYYSFFSFIT